MERLLHSCKYRLSFYLIILLAVSCDKDRSLDEQSEQLYTLKFELNGFSSGTQPLKSAGLRPTEKLASRSGGAQAQTTGYLYFWSFNDETLQPDIRVPSGGLTKITYNDGVVPGVGDYSSTGYAYEGFAAGKALALRGVSEIVVEMPLQYVQQVSRLGFDMGSSGTGPKDFEIYYSLDGQDYIPLELVNQFGNNGGTNYPKNSFVYDMQDKGIAGDRLWIKIVPQAGERAAGSSYNPSTGVIRIDNFYLEGTYEAPHGGGLSKLHYFIYHKDNNAIREVGELVGEDWESLYLQLPLGKYDLCLVLNQSAADLILPANRENWQSLYLSNYFSNGLAEIFGFVGEIEVSQDATYSFTLDRMYSQVKLEFTDSHLDVVHKITVSPRHDPLYYVPSGTSMANPILDQTEISFDADLAANKHIVFNQFLGIVAAAQPLQYQIDVYSEQGIIRTFEVSSAIQNNMQLVFRGELLNQVQFGSGFVVHKNEVWDGQIETTF